MKMKNFRVTSFLRQDFHAEKFIISLRKLEKDFPV